MIFEATRRVDKRRKPANFSRMGFAIPRKPHEKRRRASSSNYREKRLWQCLKLSTRRPSWCFHPPDRIIRRSPRYRQTVTATFSTVAAPPPHAKFFYGSSGAREERTARVSRDIKAHCCWLRIAQPLRASIIFSRHPVAQYRPRANRMPYYSLLIVGVSFDLSSVTCKSGKAPLVFGSLLFLLRLATRFALLVLFSSKLRMRSAWLGANCIFSMRTNWRAIGDDTLRTRQTSNFLCETQIHQPCRLSLLIVERTDGL